MILFLRRNMMVKINNNRQVDYMIKGISKNELRIEAKAKLKLLYINIFISMLYNLFNFLSLISYL
jgi:hypothetical protein